MYLAFHSLLIIKKYYFRRKFFSVKSCHLFPDNKWNQETLIYNLLPNYLSLGRGNSLNLLVYIEAPKIEPLKVLKLPKQVSSVGVRVVRGYNIV